MRLGGWHRVFVVIVAIYALLVVGVTVLSFPSATTQGHDGELYDLIPPEHLATIDQREFVYIGGVGGVPRNDADLFLENSRAIRSGEAYEEWEGANQRTWNDLVSAGKVAALPAEDLAKTMSNGHVLRFLPGTSQAARLHAVNAYETAVHKRLGISRRTLVRSAAVAFVVPPVLLYLLGLAVGWIRAGFAADGRGL